jgi:uncharacterized SAM-binding protein YcdF (DUF218 family)
VALHGLRMFLFLSKLLPLLIYPLGFACLLLILAIATFWKRPRVAASSVGLALLVLWLSSNALAANWLVHSLEQQVVPNPALPTAAAIVVLGGGTKPALSPRRWVDLSEEGDRVLYGAQLYQAGKAPYLILSGGRIGWAGGETSEAADMAAVVESFGITAAAILQEPHSRNTYENAVNVKQLLATQAISGPVLLVTSAMHMPRALAIFTHLEISTIGAPTDFQVTDLDLKPASPQAFFLSLLPDSGHLQRFTRAQKEYLGLLVYRLRGWL